MQPQTCGSGAINRCCPRAPMGHVAAPPIEARRFVRPSMGFPTRDEPIIARPARACCPRSWVSQACAWSPRRLSNHRVINMRSGTDQWYLGIGKSGAGRSRGLPLERPWVRLALKRCRVNSNALGGILEELRHLRIKRPSLGSDCVADSIAPCRAARGKIDLIGRGTSVVRTTVGRIPSLPGADKSRYSGGRV